VNPEEENVSITIERPAVVAREEVLDDATRREFVLGGLSLGTLLLAGCGSDEPASQTGGDELPLTIEHKHGLTRIAQPPRRVVTVGYNEQDFVLALGIKPVGVREWLGRQPSATWPWARDALGAARPEVMPNAELRFEQIAALRPDLIIGTYSGMSAADYAKLSRIAPTLAQSDQYIDFGMPWQEQMRFIGRALGRTGQASKIVSGLEERFAEASAAHPEFAGKSAILASGIGSANFGIFASQDPRVRFLEALGFKTPAHIDRIAGSEYYAEISRERVRLLEADLLVFLGPPRARRALMQRDAFYRRLEVVRDGRTVYLDEGSPTEAALNFNSPLSLPYALEQMVARIAAALDDDPRTVVADAAGS
jgi:ABC-type Fe3+-hydroxamate transport system substrate-binding protein